MTDRKIVIKLSGSLFKYEDGPEKIREFADFFRRVSSSGTQLILVAGGGEVSRRYANLARSLGSDEASLDELGIAVSRLNARILLVALRDIAYPIVPLTLEEVAKFAESGKIVVVGGLHQGQSTNAVAALIAERLRAQSLINSTDVDGVYTGDPSQDKKARMLKKVGIKNLIGLLIQGDARAGKYELMDFVALKIIERSRIPTRVVKCSVDVLQKALSGGDVGTVILQD